MDDNKELLDKNPRRSLTFYFSNNMARIKILPKKIQQDPPRTRTDAFQLARVAQCMDNYLREENRKVTVRYKYYQGLIRHCNQKIKLQNQNLEELSNRYNVLANEYNDLQMEYNQLQESWNDLAQTIRNLGAENERLHIANQRMQRQLLDAEDTESDPEWEANYNRHEERERAYLEENL